MYFDYAWVHEQAMRRANQETVVVLTKDETAVAPGTTKGHLAGPGTVTYRAYRDGGLEVLECTATFVRTR